MAWERLLGNRTVANVISSHLYAFSSGSQRYRETDRIRTKALVRILLGIALGRIDKNCIRGRHTVPNSISKIACTAMISKAESMFVCTVVSIHDWISSIGMVDNWKSTK